MEKMKTRFIIAVTGRLAAAEETTAKVELIEELSDNLYQRFQELLGNGVPEEEAYRQALEDLGVTDETHRLMTYAELNAMDSGSGSPYGDPYDGPEDYDGEAPWDEDDREPEE